MVSSSRDIRGRVRGWGRLVYLVAGALVFMVVVAPGFASGGVRSTGGASGASAGGSVVTSQGGERPGAACAADGQCFADVPSSNPFYAFINRIYQQDLVTGYPCGGPGEPCDGQSRPYYRPGNNVTRQQMAKFIDNARRLPQLYILANIASPIIYANNSSTSSFADGLDALTVNGNGVVGSSTGGSGVVGVSSSSDGLAGNSTNGNGVSGLSSAGYGVSGYSFYADGVHGITTVGRAGYFEGNVEVTGTCCAASAGTYRIDDPLDPANKYLNQPAVVSQDMLGVYSGNIVLDSKGEGWVQLPDWFEALIGDYRYQLTAVGAPGPNLFVAEKIRDNRFKIAGGQEGVEVSWQVTGVRRDPYALAHPVAVEQNKPAGEQGKYLHPTELGQPESAGVDYAERQQLLQRFGDR